MGEKSFGPKRLRFWVEFGVAVQGFDQNEEDLFRRDDEVVFKLIRLMGNTCDVGDDGIDAQRFVDDGGQVGKPLHLFKPTHRCKFLHETRQRFWVSVQPTQARGERQRGRLVTR